MTRTCRAAYTGTDGELKHVPIFLVFATGFRSGLAKIEARLRELTGNPNVNGLIIDPADLSCFRSAARVFSEAAEADRARSAFSEAGRVAIHDMAVERNWPPEKTNNRILGCGNAGGLTVFYYNVPTTTITALWSTSRSGEANWTALFPRRPRTIWSRQEMSFCRKPWGSTSPYQRSYYSVSGPSLQYRGGSASVRSEWRRPRSRRGRSLRPGPLRMR